MRAGSLVMELRLWYGSTALVGLSEVHGMLAARPVTE